MAGPGSAPASTSCRISQGRLWGALPERGDVVIVTPPGQSSDYIKRVIGLPGDTIELIGGIVYLNGRALPRQERPPTMIPIDANTPCAPDGFGDFRVTGPDGRRLLPPAGVPRDPAQRPLLRHDRRRQFARRRFRADHRPRGPRLPDGRQSRPQRRQPLLDRGAGPGRPGPLGESRRPRRVHHLLPRRQLLLLEPDQLVHRPARRPRRHLAPRRARPAAGAPAPAPRHERRRGPRPMSRRPGRSSCATRSSATS